MISVDSLSINSSFTFVQSRLAESLDWQEIEGFGWMDVNTTTLLKGHSYQFIKISDVVSCG